MPSATFLFLWLRNEIHFAVVEGTKITTFSIRNEHKISHLKGMQRTTPDGSDALASIISIPTRSTECLGFYGGYEAVGPH